MTEDEFFVRARGAYLKLIHLGDPRPAKKTIIALASECDDQLTVALLTGDSWRERLYGLVLACHKGIAPFFPDVVRSILDARGISLVPTASVISIAIRDFDCPYPEEQFADANRSAFDGEFGWCIEYIRYDLGMAGRPSRRSGPNYGHSYDAHREFYRGLCRRQ